MDHGPSPSLMLFLPAILSPSFPLPSLSPFLYLCCSIDHHLTYLTQLLHFFVCWCIPISTWHPCSFYLYFIYIIQIHYLYIVDEIYPDILYSLINSSYSYIILTLMFLNFTQVVHLFRCPD